MDSADKEDPYISQLLLIINDLSLILTFSDER